MVKLNNDSATGGGPKSGRWHIALAAALVAIFGVALASQGQAADSQICREIEQRFEQQVRNPEQRQMDFLLLSAAGGGCKEIVVRALEGGAALAARDREGNTAFLRAARDGHTEVVSLLLDRGAAIEARNLKGSTALFVAAENNRAQTIQMLLARGASPDTQGRTGVSVLSAAAYNGNNSIVALLLAKGADPNLPDMTGKAPILYAAARGFTGIVKRLLDRGIDVNARYGNDLTLLMWAAGHANDVPESDGIETVELILERKARVDDADDRGQTALMIAAELGRPDMVRLLVARGANREARNKEGKSAANLAEDEDTRAALKE
jgi:uncharacterized protein